VSPPQRTIGAHLPSLPPAVDVNPDMIKNAMRAAEQEQRGAHVNVEAAEGAARGFIGAVKGIAAAYYAQTGGYPPSLQELFQWGRDHKIGGPLAEKSANLCVMSPCMYGNYSFGYKSTPVAFTISGRPLVYPYTGKRSFYADQTGAMTVTSENRAATANDPAYK
jgi:hypothetical protein